MSISRAALPGQWPAELQALHRQTDGNPLFLVNTIDDLIAQGQLSEVGGRWGLGVPVKGLGVGAPETLWQMVEKQIERLAPDEQAPLAVAAVAGAEFSAALAAVRGMGVEEAERRCEALARRGQFVRSTGLCEWPDGTVAGRYAFIHALYQHVLYARSGRGRAELHLSTGCASSRATPTHRRSPASWRCTSYGTGLLEGRAISPSGGKAGPEPARLSRGGRTPDARAGLAQGAAGLAGAKTAGARAARDARLGVVGAHGSRRTGGGAVVRARP
jgi:hypothetical protein